MPEQASDNQFPLGDDIRLSELFFRTLAGLFGGTFGTIVILIGFFSAGSIAQNNLLTEAVSNTGSPIFTFITIVTIYLATLASATASLTFFYLSNRERYRFLLSELTHSFLVITLIFVASIPLSLAASFASEQAIQSIGVIQLGLSAVFALVIQETVHGSKHILLAIYATVIALFSFLLLSFGFYAGTGTTSFLILVAFPLCWGSFGFWQVALEMAYQWFYQIYGNDFLNAESRIGSDYIKAGRK